MGWWNRLSNLLRREDLGRNLDEELQFHTTRVSVTTSIPA